MKGSEEGSLAISFTHMQLREETIKRRLGGALLTDCSSGGGVDSQSYFFPLEREK